MRTGTAGYGKRQPKKSRYRLFEKITVLLEGLNEFPAFSGIRIQTNTEYAPAQLEETLGRCKHIWKMDEDSFVSGRGHKKTAKQCQYEKLKGYKEKSEEYVEKIRICGENRNSYSKTNHSATFMRIKKDYMGNGQLLPAYNIQLGITDE